MESRGFSTILLLNFHYITEEPVVFGAAEDDGARIRTPPASAYELEPLPDLPDAHKTPPP